MSHNYFQLSISQVIENLQKNPQFLLDFFELIKKQDQKFKDNKIFITPLWDTVKNSLMVAKDHYQKKNPRPLEGIFVGIKDNINTKNILTTCGSKMLYNFLPDYNATIIEKLEEAGAIIVGKVNMDEFAMGSFGHYSYYGTSINPWTDHENNQYVCGGSSSGSAAVVASGIAQVSIGTDTGGSVRLPAAWCGIVGFKPSYGVISRYGVVSMANSLDTVSLFGRSVQDIIPFFNVLVGKDKKDASSVSLDDLSSHYPMKNTKKIAMIKEFNDCPDIFPTLNKVKIYLEKLGYEVEEISVPAVEYGLSLYNNIVPMEVMSNLARFDGVRYGLSVEDKEEYPDYITAVRSQGFGEEVQRRIVAGAYMASQFFSKERSLKAYGVKSWMKDEFKKIFDQYDYILQPTSPSFAVPVNGIENIDPINIVKTDKYTVIANLIGAPAIHIPIDLYPNGMPLGITLMANCLQDRNLLEISQKIDDHFQFKNVLIEQIIK
jgi:aspartyl-tRNA(Asn)/glutamyl-tRNA(Gln) amidotransferase subunit A